MAGSICSCSTTGARLWQMRYTCDGKEQTASFGPYPSVSLEQARNRRNETRTILVNGGNPMHAKLRARLAQVPEITFEQALRAWYGAESPRWKSRQHASDVLTSLESDVLPKIGRYPLDAVTPPLVLSEVLRPMEKRNTFEKCHRTAQRIRAILSRAIVEGDHPTITATSGNPFAEIEAVLKPVPQSVPHPAITDLPRLRAMLAKVEASPASPVTKIAHRLTAMSAMRPMPVRFASWSHFDLAEAVWNIPSHLMKGSFDKPRPFTVPLPTQAIKALAALKSETGRCSLLFPNVRDVMAPMTPMAINNMLNRSGYQGVHCPHGWRASFSTYMHEHHIAEAPVIEFALAHVKKDKVARAYNRPEYLPRRRELGQEWASLLFDGMLPAAELLRMPRR